MGKKVLLAVVFWVIYCLAFAFFYSKYAGFTKSLYFTAIVVFFQAVFTYVNLYLWIPLFLKKKQFVRYGLVILGTLIVLTVIRFQIPSFWDDEGRRLIRLRPRIIFFVFTIFLAFSVSTAYYFINEWFKNVKLKAEMKYRQVETELKYLKNQINPHFLFNTLNNIYTLCYLKDDKAAPAVMKLSEMMRYMLYESNASQIELEREIQFINNYLELQRLKKDEPMQINFEVSGVKGRHKIAPLLLIAFFENCFKHGDIEVDTKGWIEAVLKVNDAAVMELSVRNSKKQGGFPGGRTSGVGLDNVRKRLSILYEGKHQLHIYDRDNQYQVQLTLKLDV